MDNVILFINNIIYFIYKFNCVRKNSKMMSFLLEKKKCYKKKRKKNK